MKERYVIRWRERECAETWKVDNNDPGDKSGTVRL